MTDTIKAAIEALQRKTEGRDIDFTAKFVIADEGSVIVDGDGVREGDDDADVTLSADVDTFRGIIEGDVNPTSAFMSGRLSIEGDMGLAMKLGSALS